MNIVYHLKVPSLSTMYTVLDGTQIEHIYTRSI